MRNDRRQANKAGFRRQGTFALLFAAGVLSGQDAASLPTGASVAAGDVAISAAARVMTIRQASDKAVINWDSFSVAAGHKVEFQQPGAASVTLNRVVGGGASQLEGAMTSNGRIFLLNPNGILFGPTSRINVGGLVASTLAMADADFMAGRYVLAGASTAAVINQGNVVAQPDGRGGLIIMVAAKVSNVGAMDAVGGSVMLVAAGKVTLDLGGVVRLTVEQGAIDALVANGGAIRVSGGLVLLNAAAAAELPSAMVNNTGLIEAQTLATGAKGQIFLLADRESGVVVADGTLDVSAPLGGGGGFAETSAAQVIVKDGFKVNALASFGSTGTWLLDPDVLNIAVGGTGILDGLPATGESFLSPATLDAALSTANVDLQANSHIDFRTMFAYGGSRDAVLSLYAPLISLGADIGSASAAKLSLNFGGLFTGNGITYAGDLHLYDAAAGATTTRTVTTNGGSVVFNGNIGGSQDLTILAGAGTVTHHAKVDGAFDALVPVIDGAISLDFKPGHPNAHVIIDCTTQQVFSQGSPISYAGVMPIGFIRLPAQVLHLNAQNSIHGTPVSCVFTLTDGSTVSLTPQPNGHVTIPYQMQVTKIEYYAANASAANFVVNAVTYDVLVPATKVHEYRVTASAVTLGPAATIAVDGGISVVTGNFVNGAGAAALVPGAGLDWRVWSSNVDPFAPVTGDIPGGLVYDYRQYDLAYTPAAVGLQGVGSGFIYAYAPSLTVTLTGSVTKPYDGTDTVTNLTAGNYALGGAVGGDTVSMSGALPTGGTYSSTHDVGSGLPVAVGGISATIVATNLAGMADVFGYRLSGPTAYGLIGAITTVALTVTVNPASKSYDGLGYVGGNGVSYAGFVNNETYAVLGGTLTYGGPAQGAKDLGTYPLKAGGLTSGNYTLQYAADFLTISQATLIITANAATKTYDGLGYAGGNGVGYAGFVGGENETVLGGMLTYGGPAQGAADAGTYPLTAGGLTSANYAIQFVGNQLTVSPVALTITANAATKAYDGLTYAGGNGVSYAGFVNSETSSVLGGTLTYGGTSQGAADVGAYAIAPAGLTSGNYTIAFADGSLTVSPVVLVITANAATKAYDGLGYTGGNGVSHVGLVNNETSSVLGGTVTYGGQAQGATDAGTYVLTAAGLTSGNYTITFADGSLTVSPVALTITANAATKAYDGLGYAGGNGVTYAGFVNSETSSVLSGTLAYGGAAQGAVDVGAYALTPAGLTSGNYVIQFVGDSLAVGRAGLTISANAAGKTYDGLAYAGGNGVTYAGFVNGETPSVLSGTLTYGGTSQGAVNIGGYTLTVGGLTSGHYAIQFASATFTVFQSADVVDPIPWLVPPVKSKPFAVMTQLADAHTPEVYLGGLNYVYADRPVLLTKGLPHAYAPLDEIDLGVITHERGTLLVSKTPLKITSNDVTKVYDALAYAGGSVTYAGFIQGEGSDNLGGKLVYGGTSLGSIGAGSYTITSSGQTSGNYDLSYVGGVLLVDKAPLVVTSADVRKVFDAIPYDGGGGVTYAGLQGGQTSAALGGALTYAGSAQGAVLPGTYVLMPGGFASSDYAIRYVGGTLTILPGGVAVAAVPSELAQLIPSLAGPLEASAGNDQTGFERAAAAALSLREQAIRRRNVEIMGDTVDATASLDRWSPPRSLRPAVKVLVKHGGVNLGDGVILAE